MTTFDAIVDQFRLDGRTAIVTGIGPGIGETVARTYAAAGARVVLCARTAAKVEALAADIAAGGGTALAVPADVGRKEDLARVVTAARDAFGPVTIVFNNASGIGGAGRVGGAGLDLTDADWQAVHDVDIMATFRLAQHVVPDMRAAGKGNIINVVSTTGYTPIPNTMAWAYGSTKAALEMLTRYMAKELAPTVRVNAICPGSITPDGHVTEMYAKESIVARIPLGRMGVAREVGPAALYLASDASSYVTGQTMFVDGGRVNTAT